MIGIWMEQRGRKKGENEVKKVKKVKSVRGGGDEGRTWSTSRCLGDPTKFELTLGEERCEGGGVYQISCSQNLKIISSRDSQSVA